MLYVVDGKVGRWSELVNTSNCDRAFPLWEQDQLQEMIDSSPLYKQAQFMAMLGYKTSSFGGLGIYEHPNPPAWCLIASMEQLWLIFVMQEKYNKVWDGKDWIKGG